MDNSYHAFQCWLLRVILLIGLLGAFDVLGNLHKFHGHEVYRRQQALGLM